MNNIIENIYRSERSVECLFAYQMIRKYFSDLVKPKILDVGGIPSHNPSYNVMKDSLQELIDPIYKICDFRGGDYIGDFVTLEINELFDGILFISSLEHFPQCTEGDLIYRDREDIKGFQKALSILQPNGKIILTVPFGKHIWQNYHQNYNMKGIINLTNGSEILEIECYRLSKDQKFWIKDNPLEMEDILYTDKAYGVGCFVLQKQK